MIVSKYLCQAGEYIICESSMIHVHGLVQSETSEEETVLEDIAQTSPPKAVEIHFDGDDFTKPGFPVYDLNDEFLREHGDYIVAAFTKDSLCAAEYLTLVTARGYLIKYPTEEILSRKECFFGSDLDNDLVLTAYLSNGTEDIMVISRRGSVYVFSDSLIPEIGDVNSELGFRLNVTDPNTIFDTIVVAAPIQEGVEVIVATERGYFRGVDMDKAFRITSKYGFVQGLWQNHRAKLIPVSNKWGSLTDGGMFRDGDTVTVYNDDGVPISYVTLELGEDENLMVPTDVYVRIPGVPKRACVYGLTRETWNVE